MRITAPQIMKSASRNFSVSSSYTTPRSISVIRIRKTDTLWETAAEDPDSQSDPSLTAKGADGVIGLRRTEGLTLNLDAVPLDVPLGMLEPSVSALELNLPPAGDATLSFGRMPVLDRADPSYMFRAKTLSVLDPANPVSRSYLDLQVPFRAKTSFGEADAEDLDILLDTGAVSRLVLDTEVPAASQAHGNIPGKDRRGAFHLPAGYQQHRGRHIRRYYG